MESKTTTLIEALRALARTAETDDGVVESALNEAASRMQEMRECLLKQGAPSLEKCGRWNVMTS